MRRTPLALVCGAVFVEMTGFGIVLPSLPFHVQGLGGAGTGVGLVLAAYAVAQFVAAPVLGSISDRYGRRRVLVLALAGSAISMTLSALAGSLALLVAARVFAGGCGGVIAVGQAYAVDLASPQRRTQALGLVGASVGLGFVAGPAIGAGLALLGVGFVGSCLVAAGMALTNAALAQALLPRPTSRRDAPLVTVRTRLAVLATAVRQPSVAPVLTAVFLGMAAFTCVETTLALLVAHRFGDGPGALGAMLAGVGITVAVTQAVLVGRLTDRHGHRRVGAAGAAVLALGLVTVPLAPAWLAYTGLVPIAVGHGLLATSAAALIAAAGGPAVGGILGAGQSAGAAARATVPLRAGAAFDLGPALPYCAAAAGSLVAAVMLLRPYGRAAPASTKDTATNLVDLERQS